MSGHYTIGAHMFDAPPLAPALYLVPTPIGNLRDVTLRALDVLAAAEVIYCEDTRVTQKLLERYGMRASLRPCNDHSEASMAGTIAEAIASGKSVAFASDAGTPLVSDPGFRMVQACIAAGVTIVALPGASALLPALQLSGLAIDQFRFLGFLPHRQTERQERLRALSPEQATLVIYESPHRLIDTLTDVAAILPGRQIAMARELTKIYEEVLRGTAQDVLAQLRPRDAIKGECVVIVEGAAGQPEELEEAAVARILSDAAAAMPASKAAAQAAKLTGLSRDEAFRRILALKAKT